MTTKYCEQCGTALNPATTFDKCYFCFTGTERPKYEDVLCQKVE